MDEIDKLLVKITDRIFKAIFTGEMLPENAYLVTRKILEGEFGITKEVEEVKKGEEDGIPRPPYPPEIYEGMSPWEKIGITKGEWFAGWFNWFREHYSEDAWSSEYSKWMRAWDEWYYRWKSMMAEAGV